MHSSSERGKACKGGTWGKGSRRKGLELRRQLGEADQTGYFNATQTTLCVLDQQHRGLLLTQQGNVICWDSPMIRGKKERRKKNDLIRKIVTLFYKIEKYFAQPLISA